MPVKIINSEIFQFVQEHLEALDHAATWNNALTKETRGRIATAHNNLGKASQALKAAKLDLAAALRDAEGALAQSAADRIA